MLVFDEEPNSLFLDTIKYCLITDTQISVAPNLEKITPVIALFPARNLHWMGHLLAAIATGGSLCLFVGDSRLSKKRPWKSQGSGTCETPVTSVGIAGSQQVYESTVNHGFTIIGLPEIGLPLVIH